MSVGKKKRKKGKKGKKERKKEGKKERKERKRERKKEREERKKKNKTERKTRLQSGINHVTSVTKILNPSAIVQFLPRRFLITVIVRILPALIDSLSKCFRFSYFILK